MTTDAHLKPFKTSTIITTNTTTPISTLNLNHNHNHRNGTTATSTATRRSVPCLSNVLPYLSKSDLLNTMYVCKSWHVETAKILWSGFKFVREREFERIFHILSKKRKTLDYGNFITSLELVHSDRDLSINSNHIYLITLLCPNLLSISITFHHTRAVAPPAAAHLLQLNNNPNTNTNTTTNNSNNHHSPTQINKHSPSNSNKLLYQPFRHPQQQPLPSQLHPSKQPCLPLPMLARQQQQQHQQQQKFQQQLQQQQQPQQQQYSQKTGHHQHHPHQQQLNTNFAPSLPLVHFADNCPKLKSIRLVSYSPKTDDSVYEMAKYLTSGSLESITFNNCSTIQSSTLCKLAITNPQLKRIEIMGNTPVSDSSLATLVDRCGATLEYLSIGNAHQLTDKSVRFIAARCRKIRQICIFNNNTEHVSEDTLTAIITHCPTLQTISLSDSRCLGSTFFNSVVQRINIEMANISRHRATIGSGLQRLCLGGVKRDMIQSRYVRELIDKSASKNDFLEDQEEDEDEDNDDSKSMTTTPADAVVGEVNIQHLSHLMSEATKFKPKQTVIRGSTVWWQRSRILIQPDKI